MTLDLLFSCAIVAHLITDLDCSLSATSIALMRKLSRSASSLSRRLPTTLMTLFAGRDASEDGAGAPGNSGRSPGGLATNR